MSPVMGSSTRLDKTMAAVMLAGACTFLNVYCTQPLLPYLRQVFRASELQVSLTVSATLIAVASLAPFVGLIAERRGRKRVIAPSLFLLTFPTALAATSTSLRALLVWRFLQGVFVPGVIAVMLAYINEEWEGRGVGRAMAYFISGNVVGGFLGRFLSGVLTTHWGWRAAFVIIAVLNLTGAIMVRAWLPLAKRFVRAEQMSHVLADAGRHLLNPRLLANFGTGFSLLFAMVGCFTYANFYLAARPFFLNSAQLGSIFFVYLIGALITPFSGRFLDLHGVRRTAWAYCAMMLAGLLLTLVQSLAVVVLGLAIFCTGVFIAQASATVQTGAIAGRARSSAAGLYVTAYYLGGGVGATATDWFWRWQRWRGCVALLAAVALLSLCLALLSSRPQDKLHASEVELIGD